MNRIADIAAMASAVRTSARPSKIVLGPRTVPLSRTRGASPANVEVGLGDVDADVAVRGIHP